MRAPSRISLRVCLFACAAALVTFPLPGRAQGEEPASLVPDVADYTKLLPILPEPPTGWKAEKADGSTIDAGNGRVTSVHRDYTKGEGEKAPTTAISILDSAANPEFVAATTAAWKESATTPEGYTKALDLGGTPGFETYENEGKHGTLWLMVANRYYLTIETSAQDAAELQTWLKRIDLIKLAAVK